MASRVSKEQAPTITRSVKLTNIRFAIDLLALVAVSFLAFRLRLDGAWPEYLTETYAFVLIGLPVKAVLIWRLGLHRRTWSGTVAKDVKTIAQAMGIMLAVMMSAVLMSAVLVAPDMHVPRSIPLIEAGLGLLTLGMIRLSARMYAARLQGRDPVLAARKQVLTSNDVAQLNHASVRRPAKGLGETDVASLAAGDGDVLVPGLPGERSPVVGLTRVEEALVDPSKERIFLSSPHMGASEFEFVRQAFETNWIAPVGPHVDAFEAEFAAMVGARHAVAVTSGTAALHLALRLSGVGPNDEVLVSTLTFCASVNPILYQGARPIFIDSEETSWNLDPNILEADLRRRAAANRLPRALVLVHLYGQSADLDPIMEICDRYGIVLIEDAAEALGARYHGARREGDGRTPGVFGRAGIYSFNGNKIITTSGGGMLVTDDGEFAAHARKLATQARDAAPHYEHTEVGHNYRMSNVLAGIGRGQLQVLDERVRARRANYDRYVDALGDLPGLTFMPEASWGTHTRWLTCLTIDPAGFGATREDVRLVLEAQNIEARPVWKPMHMQPVYREYESVGGAVSERLFRDGLCLPSGSNLRDDQLDRVIDVVRRVHETSEVGRYMPIVARGTNGRFGASRMAPTRDLHVTA